MNQESIFENTKKIEKTNSPEKIIFKPDHQILITNILIFLLNLTLSFKFFVEEDFLMIGFCLGFTVVLIFLRLVFVTRSPKWVSVDFCEKTLKICYDSIFSKNLFIQLKSLNNVKCQLIRSRFSGVVIQLSFLGASDDMKIYFQPAFKSDGFFSSSREEIPQKVAQLNQALLQVASHNQERFDARNCSGTSVPGRA